MKTMKKTALLAASVMLLGVAPAVTVQAAEASVTYRVSAPTVEAGDTFEVTVRFNNINNVSQYTVMVDDDRNTEESLSMMSFHYEEVSSRKASEFRPDASDFNDVVAVYETPVTLNEDCVVYSVTVPEGVADGVVITLDFTTKVLNSYDQLLLSPVEQTITVTVGESSGEGMVGDITGDGHVDISDALRLFQHSMMPDLYPISYTGNVDFVKDNKLDINDALRLFQYSMMPDLYPLS